MTAPRKRGPRQLCLIILALAFVGLLMGIISIRHGWGVLNFQSVFQKIPADIPIAAGPPVPLVATSGDLSAARKSTNLGQSGEPRGAPAPYPKPSKSAPKPAPLPEGFGHMEVERPISPGEPPALSPLGQSEVKPGSASELKLPTEITSKKKEEVDSGAPESPSVQLKPGGEPPFTEPLPATPAFEQLVTQGGESLTRIAGQHYPKDPRFGISAMILQNPQVTKVDGIKPGEGLYFPKVNLENRTIQLKDNLWYAFYGRYPSPERAHKIAFWFNAMKIKFLERDIKNGAGETINRIFIGGYATEEELTQALNSLTTKKQ